MRFEGLVETEKRIKRSEVGAGDIMCYIKEEKNEKYYIASQGDCLQKIFLFNHSPNRYSEEKLAQIDEALDYGFDDDLDYIEHGMRRS